MDDHLTVARRLFAAADALLVDVDGTLVDSDVPVRRAWTAFAGRHDLDPDLVLATAHGRPSRETVKLFAAPEDHALEAARIEHDETSDARGTRPLRGAAALLSDPRPLAIVTSCSTALMTVRLDAAGLTVPAHAVTSDDVARGKPDPEPFTRGSALLGVSPDRCVALEDAPAGIASARSAGVPVIAVRTTHGDAALAAADAIVDDLGALLHG